MTSSTAAGSTSARAISSFSTCAPRSAEWTSLSPPFFFPTGVRTASTMYASAMCVVTYLFTITELPCPNSPWLMLNPTVAPST